jgi:hypothetical protein
VLMFFEEIAKVTYREYNVFLVIIFNFRG